MPLLINEQANSYKELLVKVARALDLKLETDGLTVYEPGQFKIVQDSVTEAQRWSLGPNGETMRDGERFDTELASKFKTIGKTTYMLGTDGKWRRAADKTWVLLAKPDTEPMSEADR